MKSWEIKAMVNLKSRSNTNCETGIRPGFTVLEITVVLSMVVILSAILFGVIRRTGRAASRIKCDVNLKSLAFALDAYRQEQGYFPADLQGLAADGYVQDQATFHCPADPNPRGTYENFYILRAPQDNSQLPLLICPFHETDNGQGGQGYVGRYTTQFMTKPATLTNSNATTVQHPNQTPIAAPSGMELHGADCLRTANNGMAIVDFADGSRAMIKHNSEVTILQSFLDGGSESTLYTLIRQTAGDVSYTVHHGSKFDVTTPAGTAGALGTKFQIKIEPNSDTTLLVTQGKVHFISRRKNIPVTNGMPATAHRQ